MNLSIMDASLTVASSITRSVLREGLQVNGNDEAPMLLTNLLPLITALKVGIYSRLDHFFFSVVLRSRLIIFRASPFS